jgi:hypothetical protein
MKAKTYHQSQKDIDMSIGPPELITTNQQPLARVIEEVPPNELTVAAIRKTNVAFNYHFSRNGGYKAYEAQVIDVLLNYIDTLESQLNIKP